MRRTTKIDHRERRGDKLCVLGVLCVLCGFSFSPTFPLLADEGMWLFNRLPLELLKERHGFEAHPAWAEHVMRSCVRLSSGGSGSFVSPDGLILTNHHVASDCLQKLSTAERNLVRDGFHSDSIDAEERCPDLEILVLWEIEDVTERVHDAVTPEMDPGAAEKARQARRAVIEEESKKKTGLHSTVVSLFRGGEYHLYRYRRYDDVRLTMAPETAIAFLGGDPDNFNFPRHCLDAAFLRAYENGEPARVEHYLRWSPQGVSDGDLVFVPGNPGRTQRLNTVDHLHFLRDVAYPAYLGTLYRREVALQQFSLKGAEEKRIARDDLFTVENSRKALRGILAGLLDPAILKAKSRAEAELRARVARDPGSGASLADWERLAESFAAYREFYQEFSFLERGSAFWSDLLRTARVLVRLVEEREKPNAERLREYREAALPSLELRLFSPAPIHRELEKAKLTDSLTAFAAALGVEHPLVQLVLGGRSPTDRAHELVTDTSLADVAFRKMLAEGGKEAVAASTDPMIVLARKVDPFARGLRRKHDDLVRGVQSQSYANISRARYSMLGGKVYPDATFTLRLAFGVVKGWEEGGRRIPPFTTIDGAYRLHDEHEGEEPYRLPPSWLERGSGEGAINRSTHLNFTSTADIIGGNSGSPVINRKGELVGLIFDGNIHSLVLDIAYTDAQARAISVNAEAISEALRSIYDLDRLVTELAGNKPTR